MFSGHGSWEYMPVIIRYLQGLPTEGSEQSTQQGNEERNAKSRDVGPKAMAHPEGLIVEELIGLQRPDPHLYSLLGFGEITTGRQLGKAIATVENSRIASLLAYHRPLYDRIRSEGVKGLEAEIERMESIRGTGSVDDREFSYPKARPSAWLTSAYLTMVGKIFQYASALSKAEGLERYLTSLQDYSQIFLRTGKELEAMQVVEEADAIKERPMTPLGHQLSEGGVDPAKAKLEVRVDEILGTSDTVRAGEHFVVKGHYTLDSPEVKSLCVACIGTSTGSMAYLCPGAGEFETWGQIIGTTPGREKELDLLIFDKEKEIGSIAKIRLK